MSDIKPKEFDSSVQSYIFRVKMYFWWSLWYKLCWTMRL